MKCFLVIVLGCGCWVLGGCQTSLGPANPTQQQPVPAPGPESIAYTPQAQADAWTTPEKPELPRLGRRGRERDYGEWGLATSSADPAGIDTGLERRLDRLQTAGPWEIYPTTWTTFYFGGRTNNGEDGPNHWDNRLRVSFEKPTDYHGRYAVYTEYELASYYFSGMNSFVPGTNDPWSLVHSLALGANAFQPVHERWALVANVGVGWSAAGGAALGDGFSWSVTFGAGHRLNEQLDLGAGVIVGQRFAEDVFIFGGPQFDWHPNDQWRVELLGAQVDISYRPNEDWEIGGTGGFATDRFRLRDEMPQMGRIVTDSRLPINLRLRYRGSKKVDVEARAGVDLLRSIIIEDNKGRNGVTAELDPALFFGLRWIQRL